MCLWVFYSEGFVRELLKHFPEREPDVVINNIRFFITLRWLQDAVLGIERQHLDWIDRLKNHLKELRFSA